MAVPEKTGRQNRRPKKLNLNFSPFPKVHESEICFTPQHCPIRTGRLLISGGLLRQKGRKNLSRRIASSLHTTRIVSVAVAVSLFLLLVTLSCRWLLPDRLSGGVGSFSLTKTPPRRLSFFGLAVTWCPSLSYALARAEGRPVVGRLE